MPHNRKEKEQEIRSRFEFVVFADTEASIFNAALGVVDAIVSGGTYTVQYIQSELGDFGIKVASEMAKAGVNPGSEPIYSDVMTFENWEQPISGTKIPLPNKFVPYVAARKRKPQGPSVVTGRTIALQNSAATKWMNWYLDIDGNNGSVLLWDHLASGGRWKLTDLGNDTVALQVTANVKWKNWYLDIDGNTGSILLWDHLASGGRWKLTDLGNDAVALQVTADVKWKNWYLDIDGNNGSVLLWDHLASGGRWKRTWLD